MKRNQEKKWKLPSFMSFPDPLSGPFTAKQINKNYGKVVQFNTHIINSGPWWIIIKTFKTEQSIRLKYEPLNKLFVKWSCNFYKNTALK